MDRPHNGVRWVPMAAKKKKAKATQRSAAKKSRKVTAKASGKVKKASAKRAPVAKRAKAKATAKAAPKKSARKATPKRRVAAKPAPKTKLSAKAKSAPKTKPASKPKPKPAVQARKVTPLHRRDATGHLDPQYESDLRALMKPQEDDTTAFLGASRSSDDLAEELGEEVVSSATSGEYEAEESLNQNVPEDRGGPFVPSTAGVEFAGDTDESNPEGAKREPFPTT
jgi:hypothetical protein